MTARVIAIIEKTVKLEPGRVTETTTFEEVGIDSLDGINIAFALEGEFKVDIPDDALLTMRSVKDITAGIARLLAAKAQAGAEAEA